MAITAPAQELEQAVLSPEQRDFFDSNGYLVIEDALPPDILSELNQVADEIYTRAETEGTLDPNGKLNLRNCVTHHDAFLQLLDWPTTAPLAWQILNWNLHMITTHLIAIPSGDEPPEEAKRKGGYHRDGGTSPRDMTEPHPRIMLKIAYALSDQRNPESGATRLVPGSNRLQGRPPTDPDTGHPRGAIQMNVKAGSAFIFEQRTYHSVGKNWAGFPRKTVFVGYGYRWVKPMDYISIPEELIAKANPIQRQLLGNASDALSFYIPQDQDVPLKMLVKND